MNGWLFGIKILIINNERAINMRWRQIEDLVDTRSRLSKYKSNGNLEAAINLGL
jgi:hypothetical protein